jgi:hypothetical protein
MVTTRSSRGLSGAEEGSFGFFRGGFLSFRRVVDATHRSSLEGDAMGVVEEAVKDRVPEGGISDDFMPVIGGDLAGEQSPTATVAVVEDLQEIVAGQIIEGSEPPVVEDKEVSSCEALEEPGPGSIAPGELELIEKPGQAVVADAESVTTRLMAEGTGEIGLS